MRKRKNKAVTYLTTFIVLIAGIFGIVSNMGPEQAKPIDNRTVTEIHTTSIPGDQTVKTESTLPPAKEPQSVPGQFKIHFLDVGQADSILVESNGSFMLIDAGNNADGDRVVNYLKAQGVKRLDTLVLTHSHEDHIGGADKVINAYPVDKVYMPKGDSSTTRTFRDVAKAIKEKGMKPIEPVVGSSFKVGEATAAIIAPNGMNYEDTNDYSIVLRIVYGDTSFLLTGDAEKLSEKEILAKGLDLRSTVLKIAHHGSYSSSSAAFLDKVKPQYAVLSVGGDDNVYGHPHKSAMVRLKERGIPVYRTDENRTIVLTSDGKSINFNTKPGSYTYRKDK